MHLGPRARLKGSACAVSQTSSMMSSIWRLLNRAASASVASVTVLTRNKSSRPSRRPQLAMTLIRSGLSPSDTHRTPSGRAFFISLSFARAATTEVLPTPPSTKYGNCLHRIRPITRANSELRLQYLYCVFAANEERRNRRRAAW